jgi:hypothetical protein
METTVLLITPANKPRQPAWIAAICIPSAEQTSKGKQSAVITAHTTPDSLV